MDEVIKSPKQRGSRRLTDANIDNLQKRFLVVMKREANRLLDESFDGKLSENSGKCLVNYLKLLNDMKKGIILNPQELSEEELEKIANQDA